MTTSNHPLDLYESSMSSLESLHTEKETLDKLVDNVERSYRERISALETEKRDKVYAAKLNRDNRVETIKAQEAIHQGKINDVKKITKLMELYLSNPTVSIPEVYIHSDRDDQGNYLGWQKYRKIIIDPIKTIVRDTYNIFNIYIVPNKKPKNKFSLIIRGYSLFGGLVKSMSRGYISGIHETDSNFYSIIKDAATEKELLAYAEKHEDKIIDSLPQEFFSMGQEYENAIRLYENETRWQLFYWKSRKEYYEHGVSRGTDDPEYAVILEKFREIEASM